jgi:hypothetical protein
MQNLKYLGINAGRPAQGAGTALALIFVRESGAIGSGRFVINC